MKGIILSASLLVSSLFASAQMSQISGTVKAEKATIKESIALMKIEDGEPKVIATTNLAEDGSFAFMFKPAYEGFYAVGSSDLLKGQFPVYLKPGDKAEVAFDNVNGEFTGVNTPENTVLSNWANLTRSLKRKSVYFMGSFSTYEDFFPELTAVAAQTNVFRKTIKTKNTKFNDLMKKLTFYDMDFYAVNFLRTPRSKHPQKTDYPAYYNSIVEKNKFPDDDVLNTLYGSRYLGMYAEFAAGSRSDVNQRLAFLTTTRQKGEYILYNETRGIKSYDKYKAIVDQYDQYLQSPSQKKRLDEMSAALYATKSGGQASDFEYPDKAGKLVSLSGQKGKVVLVDVWATWCGPCKQQIPALKQLEQEMHGKDIVIMSVSVDEDKDKEKWLKMIKDENLGGVQLFASGWSKIAKDYKITGIPRFMVFDKKGNIVTVDAPRPTDSKLKELLEAELKK
ncbi:MAG: TlpA disulfide reductase family protein [Candidatus Pedobacter colombiensis]|uniref:TlpA disulfide reductase family protein n=1 Tax=Candidatus Pedobacter colombiensis TaxID=3121371 RepID=A0AAJ6B6L8_9SPHI|nr:TlpA disulfide reductase family protein [Pedobacter sp.]WEK18979.1 MAG: TlpA disulfide reductase family protein [Pedobacter sp.]